MDFHCHLDLFDKPQDVIARSEASGIYVLSVTTTPKAFPGTRRLAAKARRIHTALGLHPQLAHERFSELSLFDHMLAETAYVGEIGLDASTDFKEHLQAQLLVFRHILGSCQDAGGRVLSIHSRGAADQVLEELSRFPEAGLPILHWFSGTSPQLARAIDEDFWFSVGPAMLKSKTGMERLSSMPQNRVLLESDGPFARLSGKPIEPVHVGEIVKGMASAWGQSISRTTDQLRKNLEFVGRFAKTKI